MPRARARARARARRAAAGQINGLWNNKLFLQVLLLALNEAPQTGCSVKALQQEILQTQLDLHDIYGDVLSDPEPPLNYKQCLINVLMAQGTPKDDLAQSARAVDIVRTGPNGEGVEGVTDGLAELASGDTWKDDFRALRAAMKQGNFAEASRIRAQIKANLAARRSGAYSPGTQSVSPQGVMESVNTGINFMDMVSGFFSSS